MSAPDQEHAYDLSPMQLGMLFHSLDSGDAGMYCIHVTYSIRGPLSPEAFGEAWRKVVSRHEALRTSFHWKGGEKPRQVVHPEVDLPLPRLDWREFSPERQRSELASFIERSRVRGFDLERAPLLRLTLFQLADSSFALLLAHHHLLLDGWCKRILFDEVFRFYDAVLRQEALELPEPRPYRDYVSWLRAQNLHRAESFWRKELAGFARPTPVFPSAAPDDSAAGDYDEVGTELDASSFERLRLFARRHRLTLNTVVLGAWSLILSQACGENDIVFGATVNGRPATLNGADSMIGLFINTLPVRVPIDPSERVTQWLSKVQVRQARARDYDFTPLSELQRWVALPGGARLFESIVVFENNPGFGGEWDRYGDLLVGDVRATIRNSLPLTLRVVPGQRLAFQLLYDARRFSRFSIETVKMQVVALLSRLADSDTALVSEKLEDLHAIQLRRDREEGEAYRSAAVRKLKSARGARRAQYETT
jgi:NRPS condensation-like uncharacterized protein